MSRAWHSSPKENGVSRETHDWLREAQDLLRHCVPDGDVGAIFERALSLLLTELRKARHAAVDRPRTTSLGAGTGRHVAAAVKRAVWERDQGRCAFVGAGGRCTERGFLEYHHVLPYAEGGVATADNLELRCRLCRYRHKRHYADWRIMPRKTSVALERTRASPRAG